MSHKLFASQLDSEKIYLVVRKHPLYLAVKFALLIIFVIAIILLRAFIGETAIGEVNGNGAILATLIMYLLIAGAIFAGFVLWVLYYLHMQIITNIRIVDVNQISLLHREVSELNIANVQDVSSQVSGVLGTMFNYGDVLVQTAGVQQKFIFEKVSHPEHIKKILIDLYEKETKKSAANHAPHQTPIPKPL